MLRRAFEKPHQGIRIDKIPVEGTGGLLFAAAMFAAFMALPQVREFFLIVALAAIPVAVLLHFWRNQTRW